VSWYLEGFLYVAFCGVWFAFERACGAPTWAQALPCVYVCFVLGAMARERLRR
jgi:hypothetical protein